MAGGWALGVGLQGDVHQQGSWANSPALGGPAPALGASSAGRLASSKAPGPPALFAPDLIPFRPPSCPGSSLELGLRELDGMLEGRGRADILSIAFPEEGHPECTRLVQAGGGRGVGACRLLWTAERCC